MSGLVFRPAWRPATLQVGAMFVLGRCLLGGGDLNENWDFKRSISSCRNGLYVVKILTITDDFSNYVFVLLC